MSTINDLEREFYERALEGTLPTTGVSSFAVASNDLITLSKDPLTPTIITGLFSEGSLNGFEIDVGLGALKNTSGRVINRMSGTFSFQPLVTGGSQATIVAFSEKSLDGINWTLNPGSLRAGINVSQSGQSFRTLSSLALDVKDDEYIRFGFYCTGLPTVQLNSPTDTIRGQSVDGYAFVWDLRED